jgi:hypothetical protein
MEIAPEPKKVFGKLECLPTFECLPTLAYRREFECLPTGDI